MDLPIEDLAAGDYIVRSTVRLPGIDAPSIKEVLFSKPDMPWKGNKVGILDDQQVPEPWTPLVVEKEKETGQTVTSCWGRQYVFEGSPLPSQIISQSKELLASPAVLVGTKDGVDTAWKTSGFKILNATPAKVTFQGKASLGGTKFIINGLIEYDGMIWLTLEGDLSKSGFDQINFVMPMRQDMATYRLIGESVQRNAGRWTSGLVNSIWFGNEKIGISWFAESDATWKSIPAVPRFDLAQAGDAQVFRVNLAAATVTGFGLTPEDVLMSLFVHPGQRSLAVMVNRSLTPRTETLTFDWTSLGLPENSPVTDLLTDEAISPNADGGYPLKFDALSARYIAVGPMPVAK